MNAIWSLASEHDLKVVEDAAHATGTSYLGCKIGVGLSDAIAFSFYATKNLTTGEGGMVTTPSGNWKSECVSFACTGSAAMRGADIRKKETGITR